MRCHGEEQQRERNQHASRSIRNTLAGVQNLAAVRDADEASAASLQQLSTDPKELSLSDMETVKGQFILFPFLLSTPKPEKRLSVLKGTRECKAWWQEYSRNGLSITISNSNRNEKTTH